MREIAVTVDTYIIYVCILACKQGCAYLLCFTLVILYIQEHFIKHGHL